MFIFEKSWFSGDLGLFWPFFWPKWAKKGRNGDENLKISWNRVHIQIQHPKVSIKRYMMRHIEKVDFRARKWLSVKIWPLKKFFFVKIDFFHFIFANWVIWNKRRKKKFLTGSAIFYFLELIQHGKMPKISILRFFPDIRSIPEAGGRLVLSFSTISEKSLDPINLNSF